MIFAILVCVAGTWREIPRLREMAVPAREKFSALQLLSELRDAFGNQSFRACFFGMILTTFILAVDGVFTPYMGFHFWGMTTEQLTFLPLGQLTGLLLSLPLVPLLTRLFDKKATLIGAALLTIVNMNLPIVLMLMDISWFPAMGSTPLLVILVVSVGITTLLAPVVFATINSMFADIADEHELEIGERREGVIFAARAFAVKACSSFGLIVGGALIDLIRFPRGAAMGSVDPDVVWMLGFIAGPASAVFTTTGVLLYLGYRIDRKRHAEILAAIDAKRG